MTIPNHITTPGGTAAKITSTPWGPPQTVEVIAHGIYAVTTASHGGTYLSPERNAAVPDYFQSATFNRLGEAGWFEEDVDWCIPVLIFPTEFSTKQGKHVVALARQVAVRWHTAEYDRFNPSPEKIAS